MIPFNIPLVIGTELDYIKSAISSGELSNDGTYINYCQQWIKKYCESTKVLLTKSCTSALEVAAILLNIKPGNEVIMPSYTFPSTANAFVLRGAKIIFVDIRPDTMNINEMLIEQAITEKTRVIVPVHYAGVSCEMDTIMKIASKYNLYVVEDAAQGLMSKYKGKALGSIGHVGCFSFHATKNYTSGGEGGAIMINDYSLIERAEIICNQGTNKSLFVRNQVDEYTWVDIGSSYLMSNLQAAYLWAQLEVIELINKKRLSSWNYYYNTLKYSFHQYEIELPIIPVWCEHNAHIFYIKLNNFVERNELIYFFRKYGILTSFHYSPLHSSAAGKRFGKFIGDDIYSSKESKRLLRLPLFYNLTIDNQHKVINILLKFLSKMYS